MTQLYHTHITTTSKGMEHFYEYNDSLTTAITNCIKWLSAEYEDLHDLVSSECEEQDTPLEELPSTLDQLKLLEKLESEVINVKLSNDAVELYFNMYNGNIFVTINNVTEDLNKLLNKGDD